MVTHEIIGARIRLRRDELGLNQSEVSNRLEQMGIHCSRETLSKIENGSRPISAVELNALANVLQIPVEKILEDEEDTKMIMLFRKKAGIQKPEVLQEIEMVEEIIEDLINQEKIYRDELIFRRREPVWKRK